MALTKKEYLVKDLVIDDEYGTIDSNATIQDAAKKMKEIGVPDLVVIDGKTQEVLGVIADFDIVRNDVAEGKDTKTESVISTMYSISPVNLHTPVTEAFNRMRDLNVNVVPVLKDEKLVGVCTIQDCWSFIPDQTIDEIGLIPVKNTKAAEFWFASVCVILGFTLGIILPLAGIFGFFTARQSGILSLLGIAPVVGDPLVTFNLFDATGSGIMEPFLNLFIKNGPIWLTIDIFSILLLIFGIVGLFSIVYTSFSDTRSLQTGWIIRTIIPGLAVFFMAFEWILFGIAFALEVPQPSITIDPVGLTMSIISMILFLLAISRDYMFRGKDVSEAKSPEVTA
ncbi:MAG: CBS domain-containing protein [Promethearchaeota archaeon]|jgi:CBS domain-containing protein